MIANRFVNRFSKKKIVWIQKWHILITLDPLKKNLKFWKMEVIVMTFPKISCLGQITHLGIRMTHLVSQRWIRWKNCFTILHNERGEERHGVEHPQLWKHSKCLITAVSNLYQSVIFKPKLAKRYSNTQAVICQWKLHNYKTYLDYFCL